MSGFKSYFSLREGMRSLLVRTTDHDAALDGVRALSILLVLCYHAVGIPALKYAEGVQAYLETLPRAFHWLIQGDMGVDMFFVLSGFLIGRMLLNEHNLNGKIHFGKFYFRRLVRLYPAYLLLLFLFLIAPIKQEKIYLLANLFYVNNFLSREHMLAPWTWSLAVEEQFYLALPLFLTFAFLHTRHKWTLLAAVIALAQVIRAVIFWLHPQFYHMPYAELIVDSTYSESIVINLYTRYDGLMFGFCAAYLQFAQGHRVVEWFKRHVLAGSLLTAAVLAVTCAILGAPIATMHTQWHPATLFVYRVSHHAIFSAAIATLIVCVLNGQGLGSLLRRCLSWRVWIPFAQLSYSIYLFHQVFATLSYIVVAKMLFPDVKTLAVGHVAIIFAITTVLSVLFCSVVYLLIEHPPMKKRNQWWESLTQRRATTIS